MCCEHILSVRITSATDMKKLASRLLVVLGSLSFLVVAISGGSRWRAPRPGLQEMLPHVDEEVFLENNPQFIDVRCDVFVIVDRFADDPF